MSRNNEVLEEFANYGTNEKVKARNLYFEADVLFSFGKHFPLCIRLRDGFIINSDGYSMTTTTHKNQILYKISGLNNLKELIKSKKENKHKDIIISDAKDMKNLLDEHEDMRFLTMDELNKLKILRKLE